MNDFEVFSSFHSSVMLQRADVPSFVQLERLETAPGAPDGNRPLLRHLPSIGNAMQSASGPVIVYAATASGKSILIPDYIVTKQRFRRKLLVLNPQSLAVKSFADGTTSKSCYRLGGGRYGGDEFHDSAIVFATVGLAFQWYVSDGAHFLWPYEGAFLDEVGQLESHPQYCRAAWAYFCFSHFL